MLMLNFSDGGGGGDGDGDMFARAKEAFRFDFIIRWP